jgi:hypothetical protein
LHNILRHLSMRALAGVPIAAIFSGSVNAVVRKTLSNG